MTGEYECVDQVRAHALGVRIEEDQRTAVTQGAAVPKRHRLDPAYRRRLIWFGVLQGAIVIGWVIAIVSWYRS